MGALFVQVRALVVGLSGTELTGLERAWLGIVRPGGIILFRRNIHDGEQTRGLLDAATGVCAPHAFRMVDLEGGTVDRLRQRACGPLLCSPGVHAWGDGGTPNFVAPLQG